MNITNVKSNINKFITLTRFRNELKFCSNPGFVKNPSYRNAIPAIKKSIPDKFQKTFDEILSNSMILDSKPVVIMSKLASIARGIYDFTIDKPIAKIRSALYFTKESIKNIGKEKQPTFYRFIGEAELRSLKKGEQIKSSANYNQSQNVTDITTSRYLNWNKYRVTFKKNSAWNPSNSNSKVKDHLSDYGFWWLVGPYSKKDVLCTERVIFYLK